VTKPPRRYSDASLLAAMETAGKLVDDDEMREAMKDSGIGTPATRAAIIERLIDVGYIERDGRSLVATEKGLNVIRLLDGHALTSPGLTGDWEHRLGRIEHGEEARETFMRDIAQFAGETVATLDDTLKDVRIPRANLGPCPVCGHDIVENRKGFSCWSREDPGCGFVIWKSKAGKTLPGAVARELIATARTEKPVTGFKGRSGARSVPARAHADGGGRWRVEFDEPWAREGAKPPEAEPDADAPERGAATAATPAAAALAHLGARERARRRGGPRRPRRAARPGSAPAGGEVLPERDGRRASARRRALRTVDRGLRRVTRAAPPRSPAPRRRRRASTSRRDRHWRPLKRRRRRGTRSASVCSLGR
jgi:DNA topoisomerase-3